MAAVQQCTTPTNSEPTHSGKETSPRKPKRAFLESMEEESRRSSEFLRNRRRIVRYGGAEGDAAGATRRMRVNTLPRSFTTTSGGRKHEPEVELDVDHPVHRSPRGLSGVGDSPSYRRRGQLRSTGSIHDALEADDDAVNGRGDMDRNPTPVPPIASETDQHSFRGHSEPPELFSTVTYASSTSESESFANSRGSSSTSVQSRSPSHSSGRASLSPPPPVAPKPQRDCVGSSRSNSRSPTGTRITATSVHVQARNKKAEPNNTHTCDTNKKELVTSLSSVDVSQSSEGEAFNVVPRSAVCQVTTISTAKRQDDSSSVVVDNGEMEATKELGEREKEAGKKGSAKMEDVDGRQHIWKNASSTDALVDQPKSASNKAGTQDGEVLGPEVKSILTKSVVSPNRNRGHQDGEDSGKVRSNGGYSPREETHKTSADDLAREGSGGGYTVEEERGRSAPPETTTKES